MAKNYIPKTIANGTPRICPKCKKGNVLAVLRTWKPTKRVSCEILHDNETMCKITYDYK